MGILTTIAAVSDVHMAEAFLFALGSFFVLVVPVAILVALAGAVYHLAVRHDPKGLPQAMLAAVQAVFHLHGIDIEF